MSHLPVSDPNTGRRRQSYSDEVLPRPAKKRNVVDSSPPSEASQAEIYQDSEDEVNEFINTQLGDIHEAQADDPQLDWRTQDPAQLPIIEDDGAISDPDELSEVDYEAEIPQTIALAQDASHSRPPVNPEEIKVHQRYLQFLHHLCGETGTDSVAPDVEIGLAHALHRAQSINLDADLSANNDHDTYGLALVIHVWQVVCLRAHYGLFPDESLALDFGAYFLSAHAIAQRYRAVAFQQLRSAVQYWEKRLNDAHNRGAWQKEAWLRAIAELDSTLPQDRNETANEYLKTLLEKGKSDLAFLIMQRDASGSHSTPLRRYTQGSHPKKSWALSEIIGILASMDNELLKSLIDGSLSRKAEMHAGDVSNALQRMWDQNPSPPSIYQNCICDHMGISPTPVQWQNVCNSMLEYVQGGKESNDLATIVDQLIYPTDKWPPYLAKKGLRRYTEWRSYIEDDGDRAPSDRHRSMVRHFVSEMMNRIKGELESGRGHTPLAAPVTEIGFSINARYRLREHRQHQQSNYLMNLAEAMFKHLYPGSFRLQQLVIYACYRPSHPWFSEIVLTQLGQGYTEGAGGFSHYPAGRSNGSAYHKTSKGQWDQFELEAGRSGLLDRELRKIYARERHEYNQSKQELEHSESSLTAELDFLAALNNTLASLTHWVETEKNELASEQGGND